MLLLAYATMFLVWLFVCLFLTRSHTSDRVFTFFVLFLITAYWCVYIMIIHTRLCSLKEFHMCIFIHRLCSTLPNFDWIENCWCVCVCVLCCSQCVWPLHIFIRYTYFFNVFLSIYLLLFFSFLFHRSTDWYLCFS